MVDVTPAVLRSRPVPAPGDDANKESRGHVVVVGGSAVTPGAVILAGVAALRAGAGKLRIATAAEAATAVAVAVPEALVSTDDDVELVVEGSDAVLVGTGMLDDDDAGALVDRVRSAVPDGAVVVVDAAAFTALDRPVGPRGVVMPNAAEAARRLDVDVDDDDLGPVAQKLASDLDCVATVRAASTWTTAPGEDVYVDRGGNAGLGTSGSGDVLAGLLAGFAARGAEPLTAALWAVHVHGVAGERLAARIGPIGYLARELLDEVPGVLASLAPPS